MTRTESEVADALASSVADFEDLDIIPESRIYCGKMGLSCKVDGSPFAPSGGLMYGFGIAMPVVIACSFNPKTGERKDQIGAKYWMPPWRVSALFSELDAAKTEKYIQDF